MGLRHVYRIVSSHARQISNQRSSMFDRFTTYRLIQFRLLSSSQEPNDVKLPKAADTQPRVIVAEALKTHSSTVLRQEHGLKVGERPKEETLSPAPVEDPEQALFSAPTELPKIEGSEKTLLAAPLEAPKIEESPGENIQASPSSENFTEAMGEASSTRSTQKSSIDKKETAKFAAIAATWWDHKGPYKPLHIMNPTRVSFIRSSICKYFGKDANTARPLDGLQIVDVGCGGGLVCEPLARMGGQVTGIDAVEKNIGVASIHAARDPATASIKYLCTTAEQLVQEQQKFDIVIALEVIEHVADPEDFCRSLAALAKKDGLVFISTLNRSLPSFGLAIIAAEYILAWLPKGTHEWSKFVTPEELCALMDRASISVEEVAGMVYNPLTQRWSISGSNTSVNYIAYGVNQSD